MAVGELPGLTLYRPFTPVTYKARPAGNACGMKMKTIIVGLVATAALATATAASACHGGRHNARFHSTRTNSSFVSFRHDRDHHGVRHGFFAFDGSFAKLSGTGTDFGGTNPSANGSIVGGNDHNGGHFTVGLNTTWTSATTKTWTDNDGDADDGTVTLSCAPSTATLTLSDGSTNTYTLTGKVCSLTRNGVTEYGFAGGNSDGVKAFLRESGTTVKGIAFTGSSMHNGFFFGFKMRAGEDH